MLPAHVALGARPAAIAEKLQVHRSAVTHHVRLAGSAEMRRIHIRMGLLIGLMMLAYAALRLAVIFTASSVAQAVWAQEVPGLLLLVAVLVLIRSQVPRLSRIVDAEQDGQTFSERSTTLVQAGT